MEARRKYSALLYGVVETVFDLDDIPLRIPISSASAIDVSSPCPPTGFVQMHIDRCKLYFDDDSKPAQREAPWIKQKSKTILVIEMMMGGSQLLRS